MSPIAITVHGTPVTQGSKTRVGRRVIADNETRLRPWRDAIRSEAQDALEGGAEPIPAGQPCHVEVTFWFARPKNHYRTGRYAHLLRDDAPTRPTSRMDVDKLSRAVLDALTDAGVWADDGQVVTLLAAKAYADDGPPGAFIAIGAFGRGGDV